MPHDHASTGYSIPCATQLTAPTSLAFMPPAPFSLASGTELANAIQTTLVLSLPCNPSGFTLLVSPS